MDIINIPLPGNNNTNNPKRLIAHAMGEYILADQNTCSYYMAKGIRLEEGRAYHAPEWLRVLGLHAHRLMTPGGQMIKCREDNQRGAHAKGHNTDTLGMEFLVEGVHTYGTFLEALKTPWVKPIQYTNGIYVFDAWMTKHDIEISDVVRHSDIDPARKKDPGEGFPWEDFINDLKN